MTDVVDHLERLERLRSGGAISDAEFQQEKAKALAAKPTTTVFKPRPKFIAGVLLAVVILFALVVTALLMMPAPKRAVDAPPKADVVTATTNDTAVAPADDPSTNRIDPTYFADNEGGADPTTQPYYKEALARADKDYPNLSPQIRAVLGRELAADEVCRGGGGKEVTTANWCAVRDHLSAQLRKMGLCFGSPADQSAADSDWHLCNDKKAVQPVAVADDPIAKPGRCKLKIDGTSYIDGACTIALEADGSFTISNRANRRGYFAKLERDGASGKGYWNGGPESDHAQDGLGIMTRAGACWHSSTATICAWGT